MDEDFRTHLLDTLQAYTQHYHETLDSTLAGQLESGEDLIDRKNFTGHVTASVFVLNHTGKHVLLVHNKTG